MLSLKLKIGLKLESLILRCNLTTQASSLTTSLAQEVSEAIKVLVLANLLKLKSP